MDDGAVRCWGDAGYGNLGHGDNWTEHIGDDETAAATVPLFFESPVVDLAAAYWHTCVLMENGSVRCWGDGYSAGQLGIPGITRLGDDEEITSVPPVRVGGPVAKHLPLRGRHLRGHGDRYTALLGVQRGNPRLPLFGEHRQE